MSVQNFYSANGEKITLSEDGGVLTSVQISGNYTYPERYIIEGEVVVDSEWLTIPVGLYKRGPAILLFQLRQEKEELNEPSDP